LSSASKVDKIEILAENLETGRVFRKDVQHAMCISGAMYLCQIHRASMDTHHFRNALQMMCV